MMMMMIIIIIIIIIITIIIIIINREAQVWKRQTDADTVIMWEKELSTSHLGALHYPNPHISGDATNWQT